MVRRRVGPGRLRRIFTDAPVAVAIVDAGGRLVEGNQAFRRLLGLPGGQPLVEIGWMVGDLVTAEEQPRLMAWLEAATAGPAPPAPGPLAGAAPVPAGGGAAPEAAGPRPLEARLAGPHGPLVELYVLPLTSAGAPGGLVLYALDLTERRNLERQFSQSQRLQAIGQLAGGVAHDFNNLLTAMIGFCDLLLLRHKPGDHAFADIMQIKQNANRAANLVRQLLAFSRQQTLQPRVIDITDVLAELTSLLRRLLGEQIELRLIHGRDLGPVRVDQGQLEQVIMNLAVNARDAMPRGGRLEIRTANLALAEPLRRDQDEVPAGAYVMIEVTDTGVGIPSEHLARIFEPFFSTKEVGAGTGLGLSTVYGIVRQTGGYILVNSTQGVGTCFGIYLPRHSGAGSGAPAVAAITPLAEGRERGAIDLTGSETILLVEDEDPVRVFSARALRNKGYTVLEAKSGETALALLEPPNRPIDLLITDMVMPQMDGPSLIRHVRALLPTLKVICISGYAEDRFREHIENSVEIYYLPKPFSLKQLATKVRDVLRAP